MTAPSGTCRRVRDRLVAGDAADDVAAHLDACPACAAFAGRAAAVRGALRERHAGAEPDAGFAARVTARLDPQRPVEVAGRLAWRLLPVTVAIAAALLAIAVTIEPARVDTTTSETEQAAPSDDPLGWVLGTDGASS